MQQPQLNVEQKAVQKACVASLDATVKCAFIVTQHLSLQVRVATLLVVAS